MLPGSESQPPPGPDSLRWAGTGSAQRARAQTTSARIRLVSLAAASERTLGGRRSVIYPPSTATGGPARVLPRPCPPVLSSEKPRPGGALDDAGHRDRAVEGAVRRHEAQASEEGAPARGDVTRGATGPTSSARRPLWRPFPARAP